MPARLAHPTLSTHTTVTYGAFVIHPLPRLLQTGAMPLRP